MAGAVDLGSVYATLDLKTQNFEKGINNASSAMGGLGQTILGVFGGNLLTNAVQKVTQTIVDFGKTALSTADNFEQWRVAFDVMLGSSDKAKKLLSDISDFAARTPFDLPQVVQGAKSLLAYNIEAEKLLPTFEALGNIASAVGKERLPQLILAFGQVKAAGRLTGQELRQFTEAGVPMLQLLADQAGKTTAQIQEDMHDGAISFAMVERAIMSTSEKGGKFYGLMDRQSKTFGGTMSNLRDQIARFSLAMLGLTVTGDIIEGGFFDKIKNLANGLLTAINNNADKIKAILADIGNFLGWVLTNMVDAVKYLIDKWEELGPSIKKVANTIIDYLLPKFEALWNTISTKLIPAIKQFLEDVIKPLIPVIGGALVIAIGAAVDVLNFWYRILSPVISFMASNKWVVYAFAGAFIAVKASLMIWDFVDKLRLAFETFRLVTLPATIAQLGYLAGALTGITLSLGVVAPAIWNLYNTHKMMDQATSDLSSKLQALGFDMTGVKLTGDSLKLSNDLLTQATDMVTTAQKNAKTASDDLATANLNLTGANLNVESAQRNYTDAVAKYGPNSLEARQANYYLATAQDAAKDAADRAKDAEQKKSDAEVEMGKRNDLRDAVERGNSALRTQSGWFDTLKDKIKDYARNVFTQITSIPIPKFAGGVTNFSGGMALVGERGPELVNLPRGSDVIPNSKSNISTSQGGLTVYGDINIADQADADYLLSRLTRRQDLTTKGIVGR